MKYLPARANSLDEFIEVVKRKKGSKVTAIPKFAVIRDPYSKNFKAKTIEFGRAPDYQYYTEFVSETPTGRHIIFKELYGYRYLNPDSNFEAQARKTYALK